MVIFILKILILLMFSNSEINTIHNQSKAIYNKRYVTLDGRTYIGLKSGKLQLDKTQKNKLTTTGVTANTYGDADSVGQFTVDDKGRITNAQNIDISITSSAITDFNEAAQDAVGTILTNSASIDFTYNDAANTITADVLLTGITHNLLSATHPDTVAASPVRGDILIGNSTPKWDKLALDTIGKVLRSDGTDLNYSTATFANTYGASELLYSNGANTVTGLTTANSSILVTSGAGVPSLSTDIPTAITIGGAYIYRVGGTDITVADGGTGLSSYAVGDILYASAATTLAGLTDVATGSVLVSGGIGVAPAYSSSPTITTSITTPILIGSTAASGTLTLRATSNATNGAIIFQSDPTTETMRMLSTGQLCIGNDDDSGTGGLVYVEKNQNGETAIVIANDTSGNAASARIYSKAGTASNALFDAYSATYTTSGMRIQGGSSFHSSLTAHLTIGTRNAAPTSFWTNNTERARFLSTGTLLIGATTALDSSSKIEVTGANFPVFQTIRTTSATNSDVGIFNLIAKTDQNMVDGFGGSFTIQTQDNAAGPFYMTSLSGFRDGADNSGGMKISTYLAGVYNSNTFTIRSSGNVGIGIATSSIAARLHVISTTEQLRIGYDTSNYNSWTVGSTGILTKQAIGTASATIDIGGNQISSYYEIRSTSGAGTTDYIKFTVGNNGITEAARFLSTGELGIGVTAPTAVLHLKAGTATASTAPLKFNTGTSLTTAEPGAVEFTTDDLFFTITTGSARKRILFADPVAGLTSGRVPFATTNGRLTDDADLTFATDTLTATKIVGTTSVKVGTAAGYISSDGSTGATGSFVAGAVTVTVKDGIITSIV